MKNVMIAVLMLSLSGAAFAEKPVKDNTPPAWGLTKNKTTNNVTNSTTNNGGSATGGNAFAGAVAMGGSSNVTVNTIPEGASVIGAGTNALVSDGTTGSLVTASTSVANTNTYEAAASTAYSPALTSGLDTCMGSSSVGGTGMSFGFSVGTTWTDDNCVRLKNAREMAALGYKNVAVAMMCQDDKVREAAQSIGSTVCGEAPKASADGTGPDMTDPYIRMRLNK